MSSMEQNSLLKNGAQKFFCWMLFFLYLAGLAYFLFFAESTGRTNTSRSYQYNLIPLHEIKRFWNYRHQIGFAGVVLNLLGNVVAFLPFGFIHPLLSHKRAMVFRTVLYGFEFSLGVECIQLLFQVGSFDVDDILLNTLGVLIGFILMKLWNRNRQ